MYKSLLGIYLIAGITAWVIYWQRANLKESMSKIKNCIIPVSIGFIGLRIVLFLCGYKESVTIWGERLSISILYTPAILILTAAAFNLISNALSRNFTLSRNVEWGISWIYVILFVPLLTIAAMVSDLGLLLLLAPPIIINMVRFIPKTLEGGRRISVFFLLLPLIPLFLFLLPDVTLKIMKPSSQGDNLVQYDQSILRIIQQVNPDLIQECGVKNTEILAQYFGSVKDYARRGWLGEGYLTTPIAQNLHRPGLNDNVPSVFILAEFGSLAAIGLLLVHCLLFMPIIPTKQGVLKPSDLPNFCQCLSWLTAGAISYTCFYMIGANAGFFLFSGKNIYLLGLNSLSDVLEAIAVYGLYIFSSLYVRDKELNK